MVDFKAYVPERWVSLAQDFHYVQNEAQMQQYLRTRLAIENFFHNMDIMDIHDELYETVGTYREESDRVTEAYENQGEILETFSPEEIRLHKRIHMMMHSFDGTGATTLEGVFEQHIVSLLNRYTGLHKHKGELSLFQKAMVKIAIETNENVKAAYEGALTLKKFRTMKDDDKSEDTTSSDQAHSE